MFLSPAALLALFASSVLADDAPTVTLSKTKVTYRGITTGSVEHFLNIRYAHDTSGNRRFAPPEPYSYPEGSIVDATAPGPACPQSTPGIPPFFVDTPIISEDCLNLRISRPAGTNENDNLPVVVHIHGGGVVKGSAYDPHFDPNNLLQLSTSLKKPIIYVAINYRLTIFGFARLPILKDQKSMNAGVRDQRAAFEWVKANIASFGGDTNRITSFGLSSGGTFTSLHLVSYGGEKGVPFTQAWAMSGPPGTALNMTSDMTEHHTRAVAEKVGCTTSASDDDDDDNDDDGSELLNCLRQVPFEELTTKAMEYSVANRPPAGLFTFIPSIDDDFFPASQTSLYRQGNFVQNIPLVYGYTQDDGAMNVGPASLYTTEESIIPAIQSTSTAITPDELTKLLSLYPASDLEEEVNNYLSRKQPSDPQVSVHYFRASRILRDILFTCSSLDFGRYMAKYSDEKENASVYVYALNQSMLTPIFRGVAGMPYMGVPHGSDTNYLFNGVFPEGEISEDDQKLSREFAASFIEFAWTGRPGSFGSDGKWPEAFSEDGEEEKEESFNLLVVGGPWGTGNVKVKRKVRSGSKVEGLAEMDSVDLESPQATIEEMGSRKCEERKRQVERERLLERYMRVLRQTIPSGCWLDGKVPSKRSSGSNFGPDDTIKRRVLRSTQHGQGKRPAPTAGF
ncbi:hypothetical protein QBC43DRAFT_328783 [Cladorrhinum sp. PSN259]|nr:hypothetical protein QBC43DRAFT_328783 [Cladorrhinum sp. PSN259]